MSVCYFKILKIGSGPYVPYVQTVRQTNTFRRWQNSLGLIALLIVVYHCRKPARHPFLSLM